MRPVFQRAALGGDGSSSTAAPTTTTTVTTTTTQAETTEATPVPQGGAEFNTETHQRFKATVAYDGSDFEGWQVQFTVKRKSSHQNNKEVTNNDNDNGNKPEEKAEREGGKVKDKGNGNKGHGMKGCGAKKEEEQQRYERKTIQGCIEHRLSRALIGDNYGITIAGSGRTDAGVHASGQVFHFEAPKTMKLYHPRNQIKKEEQEKKKASSAKEHADDTNNNSTKTPTCDEKQTNEKKEEQEEVEKDGVLQQPPPKRKPGERRPQNEKKKQEKLAKKAFRVVPVDAVLLLNLLRTGLPPAIQVLSVERCGVPPTPPTTLPLPLSLSPPPPLSQQQRFFFHARESCIRKRYSYYVCEGVASPFHTRYCWSLPQLLPLPVSASCTTPSDDTNQGSNKNQNRRQRGCRLLNVRAMREAANMLLGRHDFSAFGVIEPNDPRSPHKHMQSLQVTRYRIDGWSGMRSSSSSCSSSQGKRRRRQRRRSTSSSSHNSGDGFGNEDGDDDDDDNETGNRNRNGDTDDNDKKEEEEEARLTPSEVLATMNPFFFPDLARCAQRVEVNDDTEGSDDNDDGEEEDKDAAGGDSSSSSSACVDFASVYPISRARGVSNSNGGGGGGSSDLTFVRITAECDRFLYNMMRMISGTLVQVGLGTMSPTDVKMLLDSQSRTAASLTMHHNRQHVRAYKAPAQGLVLEKVFYSEND